MDDPDISTPEDDAESAAFWRAFEAQWAHLLTLEPDLDGNAPARMAAEHMVCGFLPYGYVVVKRQRLARLIELADVVAQERLSWDFADAAWMHAATLDAFDALQPGDRDPLPAHDDDLDQTATPSTDESP